MQIIIVSCLAHGKVSCSHDILLDIVSVVIAVTHCTITSHSSSDNTYNAKN